MIKRKSLVLIKSTWTKLNFWNSRDGHMVHLFGVKYGTDGRRERGTWYVSLFLFVSIVV